MTTKFTRLKAGIAALVVAGTVLAVAGTAQAVPPTGPISGGLGTGITMAPAIGDSGTTFALNIAPGAACLGDTNSAPQQFWSTFITPIAQDPGLLTFDGVGSAVATAAGFTSNLRDTSGNPRRGEAPNFGDFLVFPPTDLIFELQAVPAGEYYVGIACYASSTITRYWATTLTVAAASGAGPQNFTYAIGTVPAAPTLASPLTAPATGGELTGSFTAPASVPPATGYTVTAVPTAGSTVTLPVAAPGAFSLTGLTNGVAYTVTVTATNAVGTGPASNAVVGTPELVVGQQPAIPVLATPGTGQVTISFTAPVAGVGGFTAVPTGYTLAVTPAPGAPGLPSYTIPAAVGSISQLVEGLTPGTPYTFVLTPAYAAPDSGPATTVTAAATSAQVIQQRITVTRPPGALILTQRCGVYGALPAWAPVQAFPGYPLALPAETATTDEVGTSPDISPAPAGQPANTVDPDPEFPDYPFPSPATYPTECGIALGSAELITAGPLAGQYYAADGRLNEVTVSDTRDTDSGWTVTGTQGDFIGTVSAANTFDGDYLGWDPEVQSVTAGQVVTAGPVVLPGTGVASGSGLGSGAVLASAAANAGLGIAQLDARVMLLIPTVANNDDYVGILGFTVA